MMIRLPWYFSRLYIQWLLTIMGGLMAIAYIGEALELLRRSAVREDVTIGLILQMAALKLPGTAQIILPSVALFSGLYFFWRLTKSHELDITRGAGVSAWNFLTPVVVTALLFGLLEMLLLGPLSASMVGRFERMEDKYFRGRATQMELSSSGIWISQSDKHNGRAFIHADSFDARKFTLYQVTIFENPEDIEGGQRIDAETAQLDAGTWLLKDVRLHRPDLSVQEMQTMRLPTDLTPERIEESFAAPTTLSFWQLPGFIHELKDAGLSSVRHELYFQSLLARPLLLAAMVVLAAVFGLRRTRQGGIFSTIVLGLCLGLFLFVVNDVIQTIAQSGGMPILLAAWGPALVGLLGGAAALFHSEDG